MHRLPFLSLRTGRGRAIDRTAIVCFAVAFFVILSGRPLRAQNVQSPVAPQVHVGVSQPPAPPEDNASALAAKLQNPIADLISVPFQNNTNFNVGPQKSRSGHPQHPACNSDSCDTGLECHHKDHCAADMEPFVPARRERAAVWRRRQLLFCVSVADEHHRRLDVGCGAHNRIAYKHQQKPRFQRVGRWSSDSCGTNGTSLGIRAAGQQRVLVRWDHRPKWQRLQHHDNQPVPELQLWWRLVHRSIADHDRKLGYRRGEMDASHRRTIWPPNKARRQTTGEPARRCLLQRAQAIRCRHLAVAHADSFHILVRIRSKAVGAE